MPIVSNVTCLGCGCACDDIAVVAEDNRIVEPRHACALGVAWFGDGVVPARSLAGGREVARDAAVEHAAGLLTRARRPLVYLAPGLSCEAQREGVAIADALRATIDSVTTATVMRSVLVQQERGRAGATLGEVRNRADILVFWGVDPDRRYPRYRTRYAPEPVGVHVPDGRRSRTVVAVDVGDARGPADADLRVAIAAAEEVAFATELRAMVASTTPGVISERVTRKSHPVSSSAAGLAQLVSTVLAGRYVVIVADAEPDDEQAPRDAGRADALIALGQALNGPTRCAVSVLRAGGNRSGADAVLTWQTGYPAAVSFARGYPQYRPHDVHARLQAGDFDATLVLGSLSALPVPEHGFIASVPGALIGPRASVAAGGGLWQVAIDTAVAGIHEAGTAIRMDDVPLPLRSFLSGPPEARAIAAALLDRIRTPAP